jgi:hypothetical protein
MKIRFSSSIVFLLILSGMVSCEKDDFNYPEGTVGSSKITYFASISMAGNPYESIVLGDTYTDPGATAIQNGNSLPVTVTGSVNGNQVGLYTLTYTAVNSDGFPASVSRTVAVLPNEESPGVDISGTYYYVSSPTATATVTKLAPGFYSSTNCWSNLTTIPCLFICTDGENITMPNQSTPFGELYGTATLSPTGALTYLVTIQSQGIVNTARKWQRSN